MGLLEPTDGTIEIDGHRLDGTPPCWQRQIAHVPQSIFLADASMPEISPSASSRRRSIASVSGTRPAGRTSGLHRQLAAGYENASRVSAERPSRLFGGGQRQRIGIARRSTSRRRARFDEATERARHERPKIVMDAIRELQPTLTVADQSRIASRRSNIATDLVTTRTAGRRFGTRAGGQIA